MEQLLIIASLGQRAYGKWLFQRLLPGILVLLAFILIISIMVSAMLIGSLYAAYYALLLHGIAPQIAMLITGAISLLTIGLLVVLMLAYARHLRRLPQRLLKQLPFHSRAMDTLDAFINGLRAD